MGNERMRMSRRSLMAGVLSAGIYPAFPGISFSQEQVDLQNLARRATIFGYAIVEHYKAIWAANSPQSPRQARPFSYAFASQLYGPQDTVAVNPNNDTIYGGCALDLGAEPIVLTVPEIRDRFYSIQFISCDTDDFAYLGTRTTGGAAGVWLIAPDDWAGDVPQGISGVLRSPSRFALAPVRLAVKDAADIAAVKALESQFTLQPLSSFLKQPASPQPPPVEWLDPYDPRTGNSEGFFRTLAFMMGFHHFGAEDGPAIDELASLGVMAGSGFDMARFSAPERDALEAGFAQARVEIAAAADQLGRLVNGWRFSPPNAGDFGTDYLTRSASAWKYIYVQSAKEVVYPTADLDALGNQLDGTAGSYLIRFPQGQLPPAQFFWSITLYDKATGFLVENPIDRYSIGDRTEGLMADPDGSLTLLIARHQPDDPVLRANWLPCPASPFFMTMRIYGPSEAVTSGAWIPPSIQRA